MIGQRRVLVFLVAILAFFVTAARPQSPETVSGVRTSDGVPTATATATPTAAPMAMTVVQPGGNILAALRAALAGSTIVVEPGTYPPLSLQPGDLQDSVTLVADVTWQLSGSANIPVIISAGTASGVAVAAVQVSGTTGLTLDGFTLEGGSGEAVLIFNSPQTTVRNCVVHNSQGDGIFVEGSDQALLFDNLVFDNARTGIRVFGGTDLRVINNTVYNNADNGISVGPDTQTPGVQTPAATVDIINNIFNANTPAGIVVDATTTDYLGNFNLNTDGYGPDTPAGRSDLTSNPLSIDPPLDFRLAQASPALNAGDSAIDPVLVSMLQQRSTQANASLDTGPLDLGYHYPEPPGPPTPTPTQTPSNTPTETETVTPTITPTPRIVHLDIGSGIGGPGDPVNVTVSLATSGLTVAATGNDIIFDHGAFSLDPATCRLVVADESTITASLVQPGVVRVFVQPSSSGALLLPGPLYVCTFRISPSALPGPYPLGNANTSAFDSTGAAFEHVDGADGSLTVSLVVRTCPGDCNGDGEVTVDELINAVNIALGNAPLTTCLALDRNDDGAVTIDEILVAVNHALNGCS